MKKTLITPSEFPDWLRSRKYTARGIAAVTGISTQAAACLLSGKTKPSESTLNAFSLQTVYAVKP
jgi:transcriptional regulator with XRE-family HTH domain